MRARANGLSTAPFVAATPADLELAFQKIKRERSDALYVLADPNRPTIPELAAVNRIPVIYQYAYYVDAGHGLMSYGPDVLALIASAADVLDKIFKGAEPANLPVERPQFRVCCKSQDSKSAGCCHSGFCIAAS